MTSQPGNSEPGTRNSELVSIAVVQHAGRFLIGRRPEGVPLAGLWEFPGGKIQPGESAQQAAARECEEEAGLAVFVAAPDPDAHYNDIVHQYDHGSVRLHFFACTPLDPEAQPKPPFRWVAALELADYEFPVANAALIDFLIQQAESH